jgi:hypothetical protein
MQVSDERFQAESEWNENEIFRDIQPCRLPGSSIWFSLLEFSDRKCESTPALQNIGKYLPLDTGSKVAYKNDIFLRSVDDKLQKHLPW